MCKVINTNWFSGSALYYQIKFVKETFAWVNRSQCQINFANENFAEENCFLFTRTHLLSAKYAKETMLRLITLTLYIRYKLNNDPPKES